MSVSVAYRSSLATDETLETGVAHSSNAIISSSDVTSLSLQTSTSTLAKCASPGTVAPTIPHLSLSASMVIQTMRVSSGSAQIVEVMISENSFV